MNAEHYTPDAAARWQELNLLMRQAWSRIPVGLDGSFLIDEDRLTELFSITDNPYHRLAWGGRNTLEIITLCINGLLEARQFDKAVRALLARDRIAREWARTGYVEQVSAPPPPPPSPTELPFSPVPIAEDPPENAGQEWVDSLTPFWRGLYLKLILLSKEREGRPFTGYVRDGSDAHPPFT